MFLRRTRGPAQSWRNRLAGGLALALTSSLFMPCAPALAQQRALLPDVRVQSADNVTADAERLRSLRLAQRDARRREGLALFVWGAANALGGAVAAGVKHDDRAWLSGSLTTLGFGAINAALAFGLLDISGRRRASILAQRVSSRRELSARREDERAAQLKSGQVFALNAGLDVFYLATGAFLVAMAQRETKHADWERGVGSAFLMQGSFLLGFDIACWIGSNRRAEALRALR